jgi:hypothetical protein
MIKDLQEAAAGHWQHITHHHDIITSQVSLPTLQTHLTTLQAQLAHQDGALWATNAPKAIALERTKSSIADQVSDIQHLSTRYTEAQEMLGLAREAHDPELWQEVGTDLAKLHADMQAYCTRMLMNQEADASNAFVELRSGAGGAESCDWVAMLSRMYVRWAESQPEFTVKVVDETKGEVAGLKACTLEICGPYAYGYMQYEAGVHRFVRNSPFDSSVRRLVFYVLISSVGWCICHKLLTHLQITNGKHALHTGQTTHIIRVRPGVPGHHRRHATCQGHCTACRRPARGNHALSRRGGPARQQNGICHPHHPHPEWHCSGMPKPALSTSKSSNSHANAA